MKEGKKRSNVGKAEDSSAKAKSHRPHRLERKQQPGLSSQGRSLLQLQRTYGNRTVRRLIEERIQPKLTVGRPDDKYEREADRVAKQVMRMPELATSPPTAGREAAPAGRIQRMCSRCQQRFKQGKPLNCAECEEKIRRKEVSPNPLAMDDGLKQKIQAAQRGGELLPESVRSFFEPRFGLDFGDVRVHTGRQANEAARSMNAEAFTLGQDVVFRSGAYRPGTTAGKQLLAHELTHVVQQTSSPGFHIQRACENGHWRYEYDGCSVPPKVASLVGAADKDNPASGTDTQFALPNSSRDRPCDRHDECYQTCHSDPNARSVCDWRMYVDMMDVCESSRANEQVKEKCREYALIYYNGLESFGEGAFRERQSQVCSCEGSVGVRSEQPSPGLDFDIPLGWTSPLGDNMTFRAGLGTFRPMAPDGRDTSFGPAAEFTWRF